MALTKAEIRDRAATDLGILRLNQSLQDQDKTRIESAYDEVYDRLLDEGLAIWPTTGSVPDRLVPHVVALVAQNCSETYGISDARYNRMAIKAGEDGETAMTQIRRFTATRFESQSKPDDF